MYGVGVSRWDDWERLRPVFHPPSSLPSTTSQPGFTLDADLPPGTAAADWSMNMDLVDGAAPTAPSYVAAPSPRPRLSPGGLPAHVAFQVDAPSQAFAPTSIRVNGVACTLDSKADLSAPVPPLPTPSDPLTASGLRRSWAAERPVSTNGSQLIGVDGRPFTIVGANWFGFENGQTIVDGLWGNVQNAVVADFATVAWRFKLMGFNTIRLPFSFQAFAQTPRDPTYRTCGNVTEAAVRASVTPPGVSVPASAPLWRMPAPIVQTPGVCNDYVPRDSVKQRLLWAASFLAANGFYVVLDDHMAYDTLVSERREGGWVGKETTVCVFVCVCPPHHTPPNHTHNRSWTTRSPGWTPGAPWPRTQCPTPFCATA